MRTTPPDPPEYSPNIFTKYTQRLANAGPIGCRIAWWLAWFNNAQDFLADFRIALSMGVGGARNGKPHMRHQLSYRQQWSAA